MLPFITHSGLTASSACVASIIRVPYIAHISLIDPSWSDVYGAIWSVVELDMGIVSACLPTLRPLYMHVFHGSAAGNSRSSLIDKCPMGRHRGVNARYLHMSKIGDLSNSKTCGTSIRRHDNSSEIDSVDEVKTV